VLPAKLYYLEQLKDGPVSHRLIMNRMADRYSESAAKIKDQLVAEGFIVCVNKIRQGNGKWAYYHQLTGKPFVAGKQQTKVKKWNLMFGKMAQPNPKPMRSTGATKIRQSLASVS